MAVRITDICINCGACIDECPVEAIVDNDENPTGEDIYYVYEDKCVECETYNGEPQCAGACPTDGCIVWGVLTKHVSPLRENNNPKEGDPVF